MLQELERLEEKRSQTIEKYKLKCENLCTGCLNVCPTLLCKYFLTLKGLFRDFFNSDMFFNKLSALHVRA